MSTGHAQVTGKTVNLPPGIDRLPSGTLRVRVYGPDGKRRVVGTYRSEKAAKDALAKARTELLAGSYVEPKKAGVTIDTWFALWMPKRRVRANTLAKDWERYRLHIKPYLGHLTLPQLTDYQVETWLADLERDGRSAAMVKKAHTLLSTSQGVHGAMGDRRRGDNPCAIIRPRTPQRPQWTLLTRPQFEQLLTHATGDFVPIMLLAAHAGLRWSEIAGLQARDYTKTHIHVRRGLTYTPKQGLTVGETKNRRTRTIPLAPKVRDALATHLSANPAVGEGWIFTRNGQPLTPYQQSATWKKIKAAAGIDCRFHDLRHSCASWLLESGASLADVQEILGHQSVTTTELYLHPDKDTLADKISGAFG